jgi:DNA-binding transcriptional LysR family regulator
MNLAGVDLNLLVALRALLQEQNVTRAAQVVGLSQPAMSNALARLRRQFGDDLLVRDGRGLALTPVARELQHAVEPALGMVERVLRLQASFDPATAAPRRWPQRGPHRRRPLRGLPGSPSGSVGSAGA